MLRTRLGDTLGTELPVISVPMGPDLNGPKLVAAISSAGRLDMMQAQLDPPDLLRDALRRVRSLTDKPFWIGFVLHFPCDEGASICLEERVPVLWTFLGRPDPRRRSGSRSWGEDLRASRLCRCGPQKWPPPALTPLPRKVLRRVGMSRARSPPSRLFRGSSTPLHRSRYRFGELCRRAG